MNGYTGKILRINLSDRKTSTIDTAAYEQWGGGHGIGSAIFFDLVKDKTIDGFDPANVITIMTSPMTGTLVPGGGAARAEMQGIGVHSSPIGWFTRSNLGGRFGAMLKFAGWDGIVLEGAADKPVWVDIRNDSVQIKAAASLRGLDTWETQNEVWKEVSGKSDFTDWFDAGGAGSWKRSTQRPAVLCIGKAGENKSRISTVIHDAGNASGQGGFGGVWGAKNLKAISVIGTGSVQVADARALLDARAWAMGKYAFQFGQPTGYFYFGRSPVLMADFRNTRRGRPQSCVGCHAGCRCRWDNGSGNETKCMAIIAYGIFDSMCHNGRHTSVTYQAADLLQQYGINAYEVCYGIIYLLALNGMGIAGQGKELDTDLPFGKVGEVEFVEKLYSMIANRQGIGDAMAEGFYRAAQQWGRLQEDSTSGNLVYPYWGLPMHYDPRSYLEWGYGSVLGDRDANEHDFVNLPGAAATALLQGKTETEAMEEAVQIISEKLVPYAGNPAMLDYSTQNMYSQDIVRLVAWHRHYTRFWKQSCLYCDFQFADLFNPRTADLRGLTGEAEQKFFNAVTGKNMTFAEGMKLGRKIWNLDNAIWSLQGRSRDMVRFAEFIYKVPNQAKKYYFSGRENGQWKYIDIGGRCIDKDKFEDWKTRFYEIEGWDTANGWPTRSTLEELDLKYVADELEIKDKLGS